MSSWAGGSAGGIGGRRLSDVSDVYINIQTDFLKVGHSTIIFIHD